MKPDWLDTELLESITDGFLVLDRELRYVYVNEAAARLIQRTPEELVGRCIPDAFPQAERHPFYVTARRVMESGQPEELESYAQERGAWFRSRLYPSARGLTVIFQEVTDYKRSELALVESEARFRRMADAAPVRIWMADGPGAFTYFNRRWLDYRGRALEDEVGSGWTEGLHPDDRDAFRHAFEEAAGRRQPFTMEFRLRRHDGRYRWSLAHGEPLFDAEGVLTGYVGSSVDIHDRREAAVRMQFLVEASRVLASSLDYETTLRHIAELLVPRMADWFSIEVVAERADGATRLQRVAVAHVDPEKVKWAEEMRERYPVDLDAPHGVARVIRTGEPELILDVTDEMLVAAAQDERHLEMLRNVGFKSALIVPLRVRDRTLGALTMVWSDSENQYDETDVVFAQDLAGRIATAIDNARLYKQARDAEAELTELNETLERRVEERTVELQQRNRELQEFAYVASHDLQEPLRKIGSFASLLRTDHADQLDGQALQYLGRMESAATRMSALIRDLLSFSRVATRGEPFQRVDLGDVAEEVVSALELQIEEAGAEISVEELPAIDADPSQMHQLLQNLVSNAIKFRRTGVTPEVRVEAAVSRNGRADREVVRLVVSDNGIGFEPQYADRIFTPFQRLHGASAYEGTGMGLAIVRRIVERHGGAITAESTPGEGSRFIIELPVSH